MQIIGIDFETYGSVDLPKHGLGRYIEDPNFRPLMACVYSDDHTSVTKETFDFVLDPNAEENFDRFLRDTIFLLTGAKLAAHNAGFEVAVLRNMGYDIPLEQIVDTAVLSRAAGGGSSLASASQQLLGAQKMSEGVELIKLFSIPGKYQSESNMRFDPEVVKDNLTAWQTFIQYCEKDAQLSFRLAQDLMSFVPPQEWQHQAITMQMNEKGWPVDLAAVQEMQRRYHENMEQALVELHQKHPDTAELNLNSLKQLKEWCADRGIKATSFDEKHVESLLKRLDTKLDDPNFMPDNPRWNDYVAVRDMLQVKQALGGSSLKKLQTILDTTSADGRLRDQYLHCGAGQTWRTSGRGVQMQNLKRLGPSPLDMETLFQDDAEWTNEDMANNLRQIFTSSHKDGVLMVGDFSSVESRGLAWWARETWKLDAYRDGKDLYKVLASNIFNEPYDQVSKDHRQVGKVGELSCGYGAGPGAVKDFAANMGVQFSEGEAAKLVSDWRAVNPRIVEFWGTLDHMLDEALTKPIRHKVRLPLLDGFFLEFQTVEAPKSLQMQTNDKVLKSLEIKVCKADSKVHMARMVHGIHPRGRNLGYFKATNRKTGELWTNTYINPKTKKTEFFTLYGGKLSGILTQSWCREIFFEVLRSVNHWTGRHPQLDLIGQFHDEIVIDVKPGGDPPEVIQQELTRMMRTVPMLPSFPMAAEVNFDFRYIK